MGVTKDTLHFIEETRLIWYGNLRRSGPNRWIRDGEDREKECYEEVETHETTERRELNERELKH